MLDCLRLLAGPVAGMTLASHGAETLRVGADQLPTVANALIATGFGKRRVQIDLRPDRGRETFTELLKTADVLIDAFRAGALEALGFGERSVVAISPGITLVQLSAFDWDGPWGGRRGFDSIVQSTTGIVVTPPDERPLGSPPCRSLPLRGVDRPGHGGYRSPMAPDRPRIYLDNAASTPVRPEALAAMLPLFSSDFANPSAHHAGGRRAAQALDLAREQTARTLGARGEEIVFTSGGTESINAALKGVAFAQADAGAGRHVVTTEVEHHAVLHSANFLERFGFEVDLLPVDEHGQVSPRAVADAVRNDTILVSVGYANNEVGTVQRLAEIAGAVRARAREFGHAIPVHTDAVQAASSLPLNVDLLQVDLLSLSGHKFGGPKGTGVLYIRRGVPFLEQASGGGQERQRRSGTENVAGVAGMAEALRLAQAERNRFHEQTGALRDRLDEQLRRSCPDARLNGHPSERLPHNLHLCFPGVEGEALVEALDERGIECSAGAACTSATWEPSHVLLAMNVPLVLAIGSLRMTLSPEVTKADVDFVATELPRAVAGLREHATPLLRS